MSSIVMRQADGYRVYNKGAAEWVLQRCTSMFDAEGTAVPMTLAGRNELQRIVDEMSDRGLRCICLAQVRGAGGGGGGGASHSV